MSRLGLSNLALALLGAVGFVVEGLLRTEGHLSAGWYLLSAVAAAPLAWRMRAPLAALVGVEAGAVLCVAAFHASGVATGVVIVELYTVALLGDRQRSLVVGTVTAIGVIVVIVLLDGRVELTGFVTRLPLVFVSLALGDTIRSRRALRVAARERAVREAHEREEEARRRASDERLRIARELHDTLAHSLVAINVRAGVAIDLRDSQDPTAALKDIKQASATALRDLRATLGLLRQQGDSAPTAPALDLDALPGLIDHARSAGLQAEIEIQVNGAEVPSPVGRAAYRIAQEALTNVLRHAHANSAQVTVRADHHQLDLEITDDGRPNPTGTTPGHGLRGMSERATALGGQVSAGPDQRGGWRVHATLPLTRTDNQ